MSVEEQVKDIVSENLSVPKEEIARESRYIEDLKADSLDLVEVVMAIEDTFGVTVPDEDYEKITTVGETIEYIEQNS